MRRSLSFATSAMQAFDQEEASPSTTANGEHRKRGRFKSRLKPGFVIRVRRKETLTVKEHEKFLRGGPGNCVHVRVKGRPHG